MTYIAITCFADESISAAYSEADWDAVLSGDVDAALRAKPKLINNATGKPLAQAEARRLMAQQAKRREAPKPKPTISSITADYWSRYRAKHGGGGDA